MKILELLAKLCAIAAGVLLTVITLMTCVSVLGRNTIGKTIVGDFELTGAAAGAASAWAGWSFFEQPAASARPIQIAPGPARVFE